MKLSFNPQYILKPDEGRVLLLPKETFRSMQSGLDDSFESAIHPVYAMILSFFNNTEYDEGIINAGGYLGVNNDYIKNFVDPLIENDDTVVVKNQNQIDIVFPRKTLITGDIFSNARYNPDDFYYEQLDISLKRHQTPTDITLMVNTICATNCFYCYADRRVKMNCKIPLHRIYELIDEAKNMNTRGFEVIGGEFFLYRHWKEVLLYLYNNNYAPYISTKVPLSKDSIDFLANHHIRDIQISLDTLIGDNLMGILDVKQNYIEGMKAAMKYLNEKKVGVYIHTILNQRNQTIADMQSIYEFMKDMENIITWRIDKAGPSSYLKENSYSNFRVKKADTELVYNYLKSLSMQDLKFTIAPDGINPSAVYDNETPFVRSGRERASCSANYSQIFILPDGNVTLCEELYWHPQFIIGNVLENSLLEIWNSDYAKYLKKIPQTDIPMDSPCSACNEYDACKDANQTCWKDVVKGYGNEKWYYPDVVCSKAPPLKFHVE